MSLPPIWVVAGALAGPKAMWLMHRRPLDKMHGGLWEFPGGKVEHAEIPVESLIRELHEELGIIIGATDCMPVSFAEETRKSGNRPIVILLYKITNWVGLPQALEGGEIGWFTAEEVLQLKKPPLDVRLADQLFEK